MFFNNVNWFPQEFLSSSASKVLDSLPMTPIHDNTNPLQNAQELRDHISSVIVNDPSFLQSIIEPIATMVADKIISTSCSKLISNLANNLVANKTFLASISSSVHDAIAQEVYEATSMDTESQRKDITKLDRQYQEISKLNRKLTDDLDNMEQYSRHNCLLLHGIRESTTEVTDKLIIQTINDKLNLNIKQDDIDRSHRIGQPRKHPPGASNSHHKPRPIIIKFVSYRTRSLVFMNKRHLKGSGLLITENLTRRRSELLQAAKASPSVEAAWTKDGRIILLLENNKKVSVSSLSELNNFIS